MTGGEALPSGWAFARFDQVCSINERPFSPLSTASALPVAFVPMAAVSEEFGGIDVTGARPLGEVTKGYTAFVEGDVLFAKITPCMENGKVALVPSLAQHLGYGSTEFHVLRCNDALLPAWLARYVSQLTFRKAARQDMTGSAGQLRVSSHWVAAAELPVPPLAEQHLILERLAELMPELDDGVSQLLAAKRKLVLYRQSLLKSAVDGSLTADWRLRRGPGLAQASFPDARIGCSRAWALPATSDRAIPAGWQWATIDQLTVEQRYGTSAKTSADGEGIPVLRMGNINEGQLRFDALKFLPADHHEFPALYAKDGEILFNRTNSPELVGKCAVFRTQTRPYAFASYLIGVTLVEDCVPEYIAACINSAYGREWVASVVSQQVGQANVNGTKLASMTVPLPPSSEQREIVRLLSDLLAGVAEQVAAIDHALAMAAAQRQNILRAAFSGRLVPQDPSDEPASVLLDRIRRQREAATAGPTPRKRRPKPSVPA